MSIQINHPVNPAPPDEQTWDTVQLQEEFKVVDFCAPFVDVVRKSDGAKGTMQFNGIPRVYHSWKEYPRDY